MGHSKGMFQESTAEAWAARFGTPAPEGLPDLGRLLNHRSVRDFTSEPVPEAMIEALVGAALSAATSSHLHAYSLVSVQDPARRREINQFCGDQRQIAHAPWFFAVCADLNRLVSQAPDPAIPDAVDTVEMYTVACVDAALAAERMVVAAESLGLGTCYIGALRNHPHEVQRILNLPDHVFGVFGLCVGWPSEENFPRIKPRLNPDQIWFREQYPAQLDVQEFDARMTAEYARDGRDEGVPWSARMARRASLRGLSGREKLQEFLHAVGLNRR